MIILTRIFFYKLWSFYTILHAVTLLQVPTQLPPERGGAIYATHSRHRGHGDTSGSGHAVPSQPANMSQRLGHS
jgi:hypothetical protein